MAESLLGLMAKVQARENCAQRMICWKYYWGSVGNDLRRSKQTQYGHTTKKDADCLSLVNILGRYCVGRASGGQTWHCVGEEEITDEICEG